MVQILLHKHTKNNGLENGIPTISADRLSGTAQRNDSNLRNGTYAGWKNRFSQSDVDVQEMTGFRVQAAVLPEQVAARTPAQKRKLDSVGMA